MQTISKAQLQTPFKPLRFMNPKKVLVPASSSGKKHSVSQKVPAPNIKLLAQLTIHFK